MRWEDRHAHHGRGGVLRAKTLSASLKIGCLFLATVLAAACGKGDRFDRLIKQLGGSPAEQKRAAMELRLTSRDPVPALIRAARDERENERTRRAAVEVLGDLARRQEDERAMQCLTSMLDSSNEELRLKAVEGLKDTNYESAVPALALLRNEGDGALRRRADETLNSITRKMVEKAEKLWGSPEAALAEYDRMAAMGVDRGLPGLSRARFLEARGRIDEVDQLYEDLGVIRQWWLIGPFPNLQGAGFSTVYPPEREIELTNDYHTGSMSATWYRMDTPVYRGTVDFERYFVDTDNVAAYALIFAVSDREQPAEVRAGSDDTITILLNGTVVWSHEQYRALAYDDDLVDIVLLEGANAILFKVCEDWGDWSLTARITAPGDTPLQGVRMTLDRPDHIPWMVD